MTRQLTAEQQPVGKPVKFAAAILSVLLSFASLVSAAEHTT